MPDGELIIRPKIRTYPPLIYAKLSNMENEKMVIREGQTGLTPKEVQKSKEVKCPSLSWFDTDGWSELRRPSRMSPKPFTFTDRQIDKQTD